MILSMNIKYKLGMRAVKTSIAVFLCLLIGYIFKRDSMFYAAIAAVICMQPTYDKSKHVGIHRFIGTLIGGTVGFFSLQLVHFVNKEADWLFVIVNSVAILLIVYLCNVFNVKEATTIACIVLLNLITHFDRDNHDAFNYVFLRTLDTSIGIILAVIINRINIPKKSENVEKTDEEQDL